MSLDELTTIEKPSKKAVEEAELQAEKDKYCL
jgi:hypothetical protein